MLEIAVCDDNAKDLDTVAKKLKEICAEMGEECHVSVTVENDCNPVRWRAGVPVSEKGENRGIGLLNVRKSIDKYDGDLKLWESKGKFIAEFFLNT